MSDVSYPAGHPAVSPSLPAAARLIRLRRNFGTIAGTLFAAFAGQALLILSGIAVARMLGPGNRGHLQLLILAPIIVGQIGMFGLPNAITYYVSRAPATAGAISALLLRPMLLLIAVLTAGMAVVAAISLSGADSSLRLAGFLVAGAVPGFVVQRFGLAILQGQQRFHSFNILRNLQVALYAGAAVLLLLTDTNDLPWIAGVWTVANLIAGVATLLFALATTKSSQPAETNLREMVRFGGKSLVGTLSPIETLRLDQIPLALVAGPVALGIYVVGMAFSNLPRFIAQSIGMVAYPKISSLRTRDYRLGIEFVMGVVLLNGAIVLALVLLAPWLVPRIFGSAYADAALVTRIALAGAFLHSVRRILTECARGYGWPAVGSKAETVAAVLTILLVALLGAEWGASGAAGGVVIGAAAGLAVLLWLLRMEIQEGTARSGDGLVGVTPIPQSPVEVEN